MAAIRQALFTGIRTSRTLAMARPVTTTLSWNTQAQQRRTFIPVFVPIYGWGSRTPPKPKKTEEDYMQKFDYRLNPLFQCNPTGVNDQVNAEPNSLVSYRVRMIINGLASTDRNIYKLTDPTLLPKERADIVKQYEIPALTQQELVNVRHFMDQIENATEREYRQVSKLVHNKDTLLGEARADASGQVILSAIGTAIYAWLAYKGFVQYNACNTLTYILIEKFNMHYWSWLLPATGWIIAHDTKQRAADIIKLYKTYTYENYLTKYQYKLIQLNDLRKLFEPQAPTTALTTSSDAGNSASCT